MKYEIIQRPNESYLQLVRDTEVIGSFSFRSQEELKEILSFLGGMKLEGIQLNSSSHREIK